MSSIETASERQAHAEFVRGYPEYAETGALDRLRASEYGRLDLTGHVYLDYTGAGLYAESQIRAHAEQLNTLVLGNPHSTSLSSSTTTALVEHTRRRILEFFNAPRDQYTAIFTLNATGALKHVGECYPFAPGGRFLATFDNHNSVN